MYNLYYKCEYSFIKVSTINSYNKHKNKININHFWHYGLLMVIIIFKTIVTYAIKKI